MRGLTCPPGWPTRILNGSMKLDIRMGTMSQLSMPIIVKVALGDIL